MPYRAYCYECWPAWDAVDVWEDEDSAYVDLSDHVYTEHRAVNSGVREE